MNEARYTELIAAFLSGNIGDNEQKELLDWIAASETNQTYFDELSESWELAASYEPEFLVRAEKSWDSLIQKLDEHEAKQGLGGTSTPKANSVQTQTNRPAKVVRMSPWKPLLSVAATLLLLGAIGLYWFSAQEGNAGNGLADVLRINSGSESKEVVLPDGSKAWLNKNSTIEYLASFEDRKVSLVGEAMFEVLKDNGRSFTVNTPETQTTVLGTRFNVRAFPDEEDIVVTVESGKVRFEELKGESVLLSPGLAAAYDKQSKDLARQEPASPNALSWQTQKLAFDNSKLMEVINSIERHFKIDIEEPNRDLLNCHFTGTFKEPKLDEIIEVIEFGLDVKVSKKGKQYSIEGKGC